MAGAAALPSMYKFPGLFEDFNEWKLENSCEPEVGKMHECLLINNMKHRGVDPEILRRVFRSCGFRVTSISNVSINFLMHTLRYMKTNADPQHDLVIYVISEGTCGLLADNFGNKLRISEILDEFGEARQEKWRREAFFFDSNQLVTEAYDEHGERVQSDHEIELQFTQTLGQQGRENQLMVLSNKPGNTPTYIIIDERRMSCFSWAFAYSFMELRDVFNADFNNHMSNYILTTPNFGAENTDLRHRLLPVTFYGGPHH